MVWGCDGVEMRCWFRGGDFWRRMARGAKGMMFRCSYLRKSSQELHLHCRHSLLLNISSFQQSGDSTCRLQTTPYSEIRCFRSRRNLMGPADLCCGQKVHEPHLQCNASEYVTLEHPWRIHTARRDPFPRCNSESRAFKVTPQHENQHVR